MLGRPYRLAGADWRHERLPCTAQQPRARSRWRLHPALRAGRSPTATFDICSLCGMEGRDEMKKIKNVGASPFAVVAFLTPALTGTWIEAASAQEDLTEEAYFRTPVLIQITGPERVVWQNAFPVGGGNECTWHDTPDSPTIGIRDHFGRISLFGGGFAKAFKLTGTNFSVNPSVPGHLQRYCHEIFTSGFALPGAWVYENFRNHDWLSGVIVDEENGNFVYGLLQNEYWGAQSPQYGSTCAANCPQGMGMVPCWINSITAASSVDGGEHFKRGGFQSLLGQDVARDLLSAETFVGPQAEVVAKIMDYYVPCQGRAGYLAPTNIIRVRSPNAEGVRFRAMFEADATNSLEFSNQRDGMCVMQCGALYVDGSALPDGKWRAWGGHNEGFSRDLSEGDVTTVVGEPELKGLSIKNLFYLNDAKLFIGVGSKVDTLGTGNVAIFYASSKDLIRWSPRQKLIDSGVKLGEKGATIYPSLINHGAHTHNLSNGKTSDLDIHLYMVRRLSAGHVSQVHRTVVRRRLRITVF